MSKTQLLIGPQKRPLLGTIHVPSDKSISHRAVLLAAIADGTSRIRNWLPAGDTIATLQAIQGLGISIEIKKRSTQSWDLTIHGRGLHGLKPPAEAIDCRNAGTCMRLLAGILAGQQFPIVLDGSEQLRKRPMKRIIAPLEQMGAQIGSEDGRAPLRIRPGSLQGIRYEMSVASAQVKSAILLAGLYAQDETQVFQPGPARDHTERMLTAMGAQVTTEGSWITLREGAQLSPLDLTVPGDISSAAFPIIAAAMIPHSNITIANVGCNPTRTGILDMLTSMGAKLQFTNQHVTGGEPTSEVQVSFEALHSTKIWGETVVRGIDELPIWAIAAAQAAGSSTVADAAELRVKEVDRISILAGELRKLGVNINEHPDGFTITGPSRLQAAEVDSHGDHRLGMALAVAGLAADGPVLIQDADCIHDSFPGFVDTMQALGANMSLTS